MTKRPDLWEMLVTCVEEADRIKTTQRAIVRNGLAPSMNAAAMRKAEVFDAMGRMIEAMIPVQKEVRALIAIVLAERKAMTVKADNDDKQDKTETSE